MFLLAHGDGGSGGIFPPWEAHPPTVHFPIAFLLGAVALDLYSWWKARPDLSRIATGLMAAGVIAGVVAAAAGALAYFTVPAHTVEAHGLMYWHLGLMIGVLVAFAGVLYARVRNGSPTAWVRGTGLLGAAVLLLGAYLGGNLVYRGGAGVDPALLAPELRMGHSHREETVPSSPTTPSIPPAQKQDPHKGH